jgi:hypothetical protein
MARRPLLEWLDLKDCCNTYDEWSDEYVWPCLMVAGGDFGCMNIDQIRGQLAHNQHQLHHDLHPAQIGDWSIGMFYDRNSGPSTGCSHDSFDLVV